VKASATVTVARCGDRDIVVDQRSSAPFSVRQCGGRILLASSAAAPVGGDELALTVDVGAGALAAVGSVAASMVWPGVDGVASSMTTECAVGHGAHLDLWLEPTISVAGSRHRTSTVVRLDGDASCRVVEETVLGRRDEASGHLDLSMRVERGGRPLVHHDERFGPDVSGAWSSVSVGAARHVVSAVLVGIDAGPPQVRVEADRAAAWLPVAADAAIVMAIGHDRPSAMNLLAALGPPFA
jgi:urease accessory protein